MTPSITRYQKDKVGRETTGQACNLLAEAPNITSGPHSKCIHELFEAQVDRSPDAIALVFEDGQLTYKELNERANRLAHYLRGVGVVPDMLVAICAERSLEMIVGLFGILKAGGAYLPLDQSYPSERLAYMLGDSKAPVLLTQQRLVGSLPVCDAEIICLDQDWPQIAKQSETNLANRSKSEHLAYCIYTSGSTGRPKGVLISHGAIANHAQACIQAYGLNPADRVLQFSSIGFDASLEQILVPLSVGASIFVRGNEVWTPNQLLKHIVERGLTVVNVPPAYWKTVGEQDHVAEAKNLRLLILGGEAILNNLVMQAPSNCRVLNAYGPTETTVTATTFDVSAKNATNVESKYVPIGTRLGDRQLYILDEWLNLVPNGMIGEIHIAGVGLAQGYLNRPDLTAEKFIPSPFSESGARMYRTGDLGRYLPDGNIEFVGRIDHQVKLRGFRIELGEIERTLLQCAGVREAVVAVKEDIQGDKRLMAYVAATGQFVPKVDELKAALRRSLPEYMVPATFLFLEGLPLNSNGKVDRVALAKLAIPERSDLIREPVDLAFAELAFVTARISEILPNEVFSSETDFFEMGLHSLDLMRLASKCRGEYSLHLHLGDLFDHSTPLALASLLRDRLLAT